MPAHSKAALVALALVLSCSTAFAQGDAPGPPSDSSGAQGGMSRDGGMHRGGPGRDRGQWDRWRDGEEWGQEGGGCGRGDGMGMHGRGMGHREFGLGRLLNDPDVRAQLGVTAEQAATIRQQESDFRRMEIRNRADIEVKRIDLQDLLAADKPDRAAIDSKLQEISASRLAFEKSAVNYHLSMRDALTPAQREKLHQLMDDRREQRPTDGPHGPRVIWNGGQRGFGPPAKPPVPSPPNQ